MVLTGNPNSVKRVATRLFDAVRKFLSSGIHVARFDGGEDLFGLFLEERRQHVFPVCVQFNFAAEAVTAGTGDGGDDGLELLTARIGVPSLGAGVELAHPGQRQLHVHPVLPAEDLHGNGEGFRSGLEDVALGAPPCVGPALLDDLGVTVAGADQVGLAGVDHVAAGGEEAASHDGSQ